MWLGSLITDMIDDIFLLRLHHGQAMSRVNKVRRLECLLAMGTPLGTGAEGMYKRMQYHQRELPCDPARASPVEQLQVLK